MIGTLTACASKQEPLPEIKNAGIENPYPPMPSDLVVPCKRAEVKGVHPRIAWRRAEAAFDKCAAKQARTVKWYDGLRSTRSGDVK